MSKTPQELIATMAAGQEARTEAEALILEMAQLLHNAGDVVVTDGVLNSNGIGGITMDCYNLPPQIHTVYENAWDTSVVVLIIPKRKQEGKA